MQYELGLKVARQFNSAIDDEWVYTFEKLRRQKKLLSAMRELNALLRHPKYGNEAENALKRIGLWNLG